MSVYSMHRLLVGPIPLSQLPPQVADAEVIQIGDTVGSAIDKCIYTANNDKLLRGYVLPSILLHTNDYYNIVDNFMNEEHICVKKYFFNVNVICTYFNFFFSFICKKLAMHMAIAVSQTLKTYKVLLPEHGIYDVNNNSTGATSYRLLKLAYDKFIE